jgi:hypothetical protein
MLETSNQIKAERTLPSMMPMSGKVMNQTNPGDTTLLNTAHF